MNNLKKSAALFCQRLAEVKQKINIRLPYAELQPG